MIPDVLERSIFKPIKNAIINQKNTYHILPTRSPTPIQTNTSAIVPKTTIRSRFMLNLKIKQCAY